MRKKPRWTDDKIDLLRKEYPLGDKKELCTIFNCSYLQLKDIARRYKIKSLKDYNLYQLKWFLTDELEVFYWLGFILADGNFTKNGTLRIRLGLKDKEYLQQLGNKLNVQVKEYTFKTNFYTERQTACNLSVSDKANVPFIMKRLNLTDFNKTKNPPTSLDFLKTEEQFKAFFCGFIDGDGSIRHRKEMIQTIKLECHKNWYPAFEALKNKIPIQTYLQIDSRGYSLLNIHNSQYNFDLRTFAEQNNLPIMKRKWYRKEVKN